MRIYALSLFVLFGCSEMEQSYQRDMDRIRIKDVNLIVNSLGTYYEANSNFPFQNESGDKPIEVIVSDRKIPKWLEDQKGITGINYRTHAELESELRKACGEDFLLPSEPQNVETFAPNFYQYHVEPNFACVSANLYFPTKETQPVQGRYHKYQICMRTQK